MARCGPVHASESPVAASATIMAAVGAFALLHEGFEGKLRDGPHGCRPATNTAQVIGLGEIGGYVSTSGIALCEVTTRCGPARRPPGQYLGASNVGTGNNILIGGFCHRRQHGGNRLDPGGGTGLTDVFGLTGTLAPAVLTLFNNSGHHLFQHGLGRRRDNCRIFPRSALQPESCTCGSVLLVTLPPGNYTAQ